MQEEVSGGKVLQPSGRNAEILFWQDNVCVCPIYSFTVGLLYCLFPTRPFFSSVERFRAITAWCNYSCLLLPLQVWFNLNNHISFVLLLLFEHPWWLYTRKGFFAPFLGNVAAHWKLSLLWLQRKVYFFLLG